MSYAVCLQANAPQTLHIGQWIALVVRVLALIILGYFAVVCLNGLKKTLEQKAIGIETSWGLGGSLGGWSASKSLTWFVGAMVSIVLFFALALHVHDGLDSAPPTQGGAAAEEQKKKNGNTKNENTRNETKSEPAPSPPAGNAGDQSKSGASSAGDKDSKSSPEKK